MLSCSATPVQILFHRVKVVDAELTTNIDKDPTLHKNIITINYAFASGLAGIVFDYPKSEPVKATHYFNKHIGQWVERKKPF